MQLHIPLEKLLQCASGVRECSKRLEDSMGKQGWMKSASLTLQEETEKANSPVICRLFQIFGLMQRKLFDASSKHVPCLLLYRC